MSKIELQRLYDWLLDDNREFANTKFTEGMTRNVARQIEWVIHKKEKAMIDWHNAELREELKEFCKWMYEEVDPEIKPLNDVDAESYVEDYLTQKGEHK